MARHLSSRIRFGVAIVAALLVPIVGSVTQANAPASASGQLNVAVGDASITEGNSGARSLSFAITLSAPSATAVSVQYSVAGVSATGGASATAGVDFKSSAIKTLSFPVTGSGFTAVQKFVKIPVYGDAVLEST